MNRMIIMSMTGTNMSTIMVDMIISNMTIMNMTRIKGTITTIITP